MAVAKHCTVRARLKRRCFIESIDTPLAQYFPELYNREDTRWQRITLRHLLTHTSGIDCADTEYETAWRNSDNWIQFVLDRPMAYEPGEVFAYSTANTHLLCAVVQQATGQTLYEFGKENLLDPVGMESVTCDTDAQGISDGGNGIYMSIYDMARFGLLYLNGGDLFELVPSDPYTDADLDWTDENSRVVHEYENESERDVALEQTSVENWAECDTVFIGYPIWWGIAAWPVNTFIDANDFSSKTVIPFCTSSSSGLGASGDLLAEAAGTGNWLEGERFRSSASESDVTDWVNGLGL